MKPFAVLIPERIDIEGIVNVNPSLFEEDYLRYLINMIVIKQGRMIENHELEMELVFDKKPYYGCSERYVKIESLKKGTQYPKHKKLCEYLCRDSVMVNRSRTTTKLVSIFERIPYIPEKNSFEYRIGAYYRKSKLKIEFIQDQQIIKAIKGNESKCDSELKRGHYKFFQKYFDQNRLQIDLPKAVELCELRHEGHKQYDKYVKEMTQITNLYNGIYRLTFKKNSLGRIYTNLTQLPKVYRRFVSYNDKKLSEMDVSNSVIFFMGILLENILDKDSIKELFNKDIYNNILNGESSFLLLMFYKSFENLSQREVQLIQQLGRNGTFYDEFVFLFDEYFTFEEMRDLYEEDNEDSYVGTDKQKRKISKKQLLAMLFAKPIQYLKEQEVFKMKFPELLDRINKFKDEVGHEKLSYLLFQIEACFVLDVVGRIFNKENYRNAPVFTLHYCLITTSDYVDKLEQVFNESFIEYFDCFPKTEIKEW
ncbi:hypothetical protein [Chryseobacterium sp. OSA05B]|uniref:hypothetical protein n=1 Tax=Chryseobacterium sp. OSA05B TaxID=2862650 RepID=UPI001CBAE721|nr:hypothetical protein [Chryseobacterium sp. OSA05B]